MILLTDEEAQEVLDAVPVSAEWDLESAKAVAKAQLRKVVEFLRKDGFCVDCGGGKRLADEIEAEIKGE